VAATTEPLANDRPACFDIPREQSATRSAAAKTPDVIDERHTGGPLNTSRPVLHAAGRAVAASPFFDWLWATHGTSWLLRPTRPSSAKTTSLLPFRNVEGDGGADQLFERRFLNGVVFVNVDGPSCIALKARIEETSGILQRGSMKEGQLDGLFVGFACTDTPESVRP
jgi:hypothetical protein